MFCYVWGFDVVEVLIIGVKNTHNADIIRYCKTVKHLVGSARSCGKKLLLFYLSYMIAQPLRRLVVLSLPLPGC